MHPTTLREPAYDRQQARQRVRTPADAAGLGTVLGLWAHPDDETYLSAGLMALASAAGATVVCAHATDGERGTDDPVAWPADRVARVRSREARAALRILGVHRRWSLGLPDGGCADLDDSDVVPRLVDCIARVRPTTIVTFGPDGNAGKSGSPNSR